MTNHCFGTGEKSLVSKQLVGLTDFRRCLLQVIYEKQNEIIHNRFIHNGFIFPDGFNAITGTRLPSLHEGF